MLHVHDYYEVYICLCASIYYLAGSRQHKLSYGDVILLPPGTYHYAYNGNGELYRRARLEIGRATAERFSSYQHGLFSGFLETGWEVRCGDSLAQRLDELEEALTHTGDDACLYAALACIKLLADINSIRVSGESDISSMHVPAMLVDILRYINEEENYTRISANREIAGYFYITESYLSRLFKKYMPVSAHRYLLSLKLEYAKKLLSSGSSVTEACFASGFSDCSNFIAAYKNHTGETPGSFQKKQR